MSNTITSELARRFAVIGVAASAALLGGAAPSLAQRLLGIDISAWQDSISVANWSTLHNTNERDFVFIRSSRGGTTGFDHNHDNILSSNANCNGVSTDACLSRRYDDPYFGQNITRATNEGLFAGTYHRSRADVIASTPDTGGIANNGTDEATHMIQMAGAWMRPGYLPPVLDFEDGINEHTDVEMAQFALDFSNHIYEVMQIRPAIYSNGNYAQNVLGGGTAAQRSELAQQSSNPPSVVSPAFPTLWSARWPNQMFPDLIDVQNEDPKNSFANIYGPWDDYGVEFPWSFWQYASTAHLSGYKNGTTNIDVNVSHGDIEFVKDQLIPALWWNDSSGDWSTLANWNSGQPVVAPPVVPNMTPVQGSTTLPVARLPGAVGSGPTSGQHDTVILERPNADITVTLSTGAHNIRKLYVRETLDITGGSLNINYDPDYAVPLDGGGDPLYPNAVRSGPLSAQFSGAVSLSGTAALSVNTLQVDATQTFTLGGGNSSLTFKTINLMPHGTTPAKIAVGGNANINPLANATATIANGAGAGSSGFVDLSGGTRVFNVGNGTSDVDLAVNVPITNGGLTKNGAGTMSLGGANTFDGPVTVNSGTLRYDHASGLSSSSLVTVNNGGTLDMNNIGDTIAGLASAAGSTTGVVAQGTADLTLDSASGSNTYEGTITGTGTLTKTGGSTQILTGNNTLGPVTLGDGLLILNGINTTGPVTVHGGTLGGTGSVSSAVTVNSDAHFAPGASIGSFGVEALTLNGGSILDVELGAPGVGDLIAVSGLLTLSGGSVNLTDAGGMSAGTYTLIDYGSFSGDVSSLGIPTGPGGFVYNLIDTGSAINLAVALPGVAGDFNEDDVVDAADYVVWRRAADMGLDDLPNDNDLAGNVGSAEYDLWRANFGAVAPGGGSGTSGAVPEPATAALLLIGLCWALAIRSGRPFLNWPSPRWGAQ